MINLILFLLLTFQQEALPYKPADEFTITLNSELKPKGKLSTASTNTFDQSMMDDMSEQKHTAPVQFISLNLKLVKLPNKEAKLRAENGQKASIFNKKIKEGITCNIPLTFADELDPSAPKEYDLIFIDSDKKEINRIHVTLDASKTYMINGEVKGKI